MKNRFLFVSHYINQNKFLFLSSLIVITLGSGAQLLLVFIQQYIIDSIILDENYNMLLSTILIFIVLFVLLTITFTLGPHLMHRNVSKISTEINNNFFNSIFSMPIEELDKKRNARLVHYITDDIPRVAWLCAETTPNLIKEIFVALFLIVIIGNTNIILLIVSILFSILYIWIGYRSSSKSVRTSRAVQEGRSDFIIKMEESISSTREVISYNRASWEKELFQRSFNKYFDKVKKQATFQNQQLYKTEPIKWGINIFILVYGGYLVMNGSISIGNFVVIYQLSFNLLNSFQNLFQTFLTLTQESASIDRVNNVLYRSKKIKQLKNKNENIQKVEHIKLYNIYVEYSENLILEDINMHIQADKQIAIIGESGSGKSTIVKLLLNFLVPKSGSIYINDVPIHDIGIKSLNRKVNVVFQEPYFFPETIKTNIVLGLEDISMSKIRDICKLVNMDKFIMGLPHKYNTVLGEGGLSLSGGQRQRIAIARALIRDPEILVLDEATSALDALTSKEVLYNIEKYRKGKTTIIISHRLNDFLNSDVIYVFNKGKIVGVGTHEDLLCNNYYKKLVSQN
ncbi:ABC transporter ATP-binding protein [Oceanobacillus sp. 1P07AA]|uniref:ABC transporter ATP-binding protein n=1 Tax=Oceanobacillus sp. 1P07AA TaxID=3132293 RepID=UPI0039A4F229